MVKIADDLARATELIRTFAGTGDTWDRAMDSADRDALVWLLEVARGQHAYVRSQTFRDVVMAAYQMGIHVSIAEPEAGVSGPESGHRTERPIEQHSE